MALRLVVDGLKATAEPNPTERMQSALIKAGRQGS